MLQEESRTGLFLTHKLWTQTLFQSYFQVLSGLHFHLSSRIHWTNCFELSIIEPIPVGNMGGVEVDWGVHQNAHVKEVVAGGLCVFEHIVLWVWDVGVWILSWVTWIWHWAWFFFTWVSVCYRTVVLQKPFSCMCGVWQAPCPQECPAPAYESKSFQINHIHSIISYSCLPCMSFTFSPLTKSFFMGKL